MKKEIIIRIIVEKNKIGSIIQKIGFEDGINSEFEAMGILNKIVSDEQIKLNAKLNVENNYKIKRKYDE